MPPLYEYECEQGHVFDRLLKTKDYKEPQTCDCGSGSRKRITVAMIAPSFEDYESPIDGRPITSKRKRLDDMERNGCVEYEPSLRDETTKNMKTQEDKLERDMDNTVDYEISKMPARKKELLDQELKAGANIDYHRG